MTITTAEPRSASRPSRRHRTLAASAVAGAVALSLSLGVGAAQAGTAGTLSAGHVDTGFVALQTGSYKLTLGSNVDDNPSYADAYYTRGQVNATAAHNTPAYDFEVNSGAKHGSVWVIQDNLPDADADDAIFAGFAGAAEDKSQGSTRVARSLFAGGKIGADDHLIYKVNVDSGSAGTVGLDFSTAQANGEDVTSTGSSGAGYTVTFGLGNADDEEAFHVHPKWTFSAAGDYWIKVVASTDASGVTQSDPTYYHFHVDA